MTSPFDFSAFYQALNRHGLQRWQKHLQNAVETAINKPDGNLPGWLAALQKLPELADCRAEIDRKIVSAISKAPVSTGSAENLRQALLQLQPWRKGPFDICGTFIDSEWRCDMKWERVAPHISSLRGRKVLDVGCGNGYYLFRMASMGAALTIGIDPSMLFLAQFSAVQKYLKVTDTFLLPVGFEDLPENMEAFDTVFSMGVFYHRRSPFDFLKSLKMLLRRGGELVLETLVIAGDENQVLVPQDRYARMNNVWFIPSVPALCKWLTKIGFADVRLADAARTTVEEQRTTTWMPGESLEKCLDPQNHDLTIEGLPAPVRAVIVATRP